jgi:hypothetical protein
MAFLVWLEVKVKGLDKEKANFTYLFSAFLRASATQPLLTGLYNTLSAGTSHPAGKIK